VLIAFTSQPFALQIDTEIGKKPENQKQWNDDPMVPRGR